MADAAEALAGLRAIHPPADLGLAPIAAAAALAGCLFALAALAWLRRRRPGGRRVRRSALAALAMARSLPSGERLAAQAALLRRVVRAIEGEASARLRDRDWLACLDRVFATGFFSGGAGRAFGAALYRPPNGENVASIDDALEKLFARLPR
jgi:hypothetical protein